MIKKLAKCVREYKGVTIASMVFISLEVVMEVCIPFVMSSLIDKGINAGNQGVIIKSGIILLIIAVLSLTFGHHFVRILRRQR